MLILEGSDCLGKTTAAKRIVELCSQRAEKGVTVPETDWESLDIDQWPHPVRYCHMTRPNCSFDFYEDYRDMITKYAVQDRFHLGGLVWHENAINKEQLYFIENWLAIFASVVVIFASPDDQWYTKKLLEHPRREMFGVKVLVDANTKYMDMISGTFPLPVRYDYQILIGPDNDYPNDDILNPIIDTWYKRLNMVTS